MTGKESPSSISPLQSVVVGLIAIAAALTFSGPFSIDMAGAQGAPADPYAPANPYGPEPEVTVIDDEVCGGEAVVVTVSNVTAGDSVEVTFAGQSQSLTAGSTGTASSTFPTGSTPTGSYTIAVTTGSGASTSLPVTVLSAQDCTPEPPPALSIADPSVCGGESAVATVTGRSGTSVTITFAGQSNTVTIGSDGTASTSFPTSGLTPGEYSFVADDGNGQSASAPLFVLDPSGPECSPTPPPPSGPYLTISASNTCLDQPVVATVTGANPGDGITVTLAGNTADVTAGADGSAQVSLSTGELTTGTYDVAATTTSGKGDSTQVRVLGADDCEDSSAGGGSAPPNVAATPDPGGLLAFTGSNVSSLVVGGAFLVTIGGFLVWRVRRSATA